MGVSHIDGRVDRAELRRQRGKTSVYRELRFALEGGGERTIKNAVVHADVAQHLTPGTAGRFYLYSQMDGRGVYAFRAPSGELVNAYPRSIENLFLFLIIANLAMMVFYQLVMGEGTPLLVFIALLIGVVGYVLTRRTRAEAGRAVMAHNTSNGAGLRTGGATV